MKRKLMRLADAGGSSQSRLLEVTPPQTSKESVDTMHGSEEKWAIDLVPGKEP